MINAVKKYEEVKRYGGNKPSKWGVTGSPCHYFPDYFTTLPSLCIMAIVRSYTGDAYNWNHQFNSKLKQKNSSQFQGLEFNTFFYVFNESLFLSIWDLDVT